MKYPFAIAIALAGLFALPALAGPANEDVTLVSSDGRSISVLKDKEAVELAWAMAQPAVTITAADAVRLQEKIVCMVPSGTKAKITFKAGNTLRIVEITSGDDIGCKGIVFSSSIK